FGTAKPGRETPVDRFQLAVHDLFLATLEVGLEHRHADSNLPLRAVHYRKSAGHTADALKCFFVVDRVSLLSDVFELLEQLLWVADGVRCECGQRVGQVFRQKVVRKTREQRLTGAGAVRWGWLTDFGRYGDSPPSLSPGQVDDGALGAEHGQLRGVDEATRVLIAHLL